MKAAELHGLLAAEEPAFGCFISLGSALAMEATMLGGFSWVLVDLEHGAGSETALATQIMAADSHGIPVLVRVEAAERIRIGRALDLGASGIMFPRLDATGQVKTAVKHLYYPPLGDRGVATYNRAASYGLRSEVLSSANQQVVGIVQIETLDALEQVEEIAKIQGIQVLFVGPRDLAHALGVPNEPDAPIFQKAIERVAAAAAAAGKVAGILANDARSAAGYVARGYRFVAIGSDASLLASTAEQVIKEAQRLTSAVEPGAKMANTLSERNERMDVVQISLQEVPSTKLS